MEPINQLAELVINSANDVLAGNQTFEEHLIFLQSEKDRLNQEGVKLPLDLSEPERNLHEQNYTGNCQQESGYSRNKPGSGKKPKTFQSKKVEYTQQGVLSWTDRS